MAAATLALALSSAPTRADTITVVNGEVAIHSNGKCSLIEAIINANDTTSGRPHADCAKGNPGGADTISLPANGTFSLTAVADSLYGATGLPTIESAITIQGNGATIQRTGSAKFRLLAVGDGGALTLDNVKLKNGLAPNEYGGGIMAYGDLTLSNSTISGSTATYAGGAVFAADGVKVTVTGGQFTGNRAADGGGFALYSVNAALTNVTLQGNQAEGGYGGGAYVQGGTVAISGGAISGNSSAENGGGLAVEGGTATITNAAISGNTAPSGGGIDQYGGTVALQRSLVSGNKATANGGGIMAEGGTVSIVNSTLSGNSAAAGGGAANLGAMTLNNVTVTGNSASGNGGGLLNQGADATMTLNRNLVVGNSAAGQGREVNHAGKTIAGGNFNLFGYGGNSGIAGFTPGGNSFTPAGAPASILSATLADNGGPTKTHALAAGSAAIDRAPSAACTAAPVDGVDQRGQARNSDGNGVSSSNECDIGAFEFSLPPTPTPTHTPTYTHTPTNTPTHTNTPANTPTYTHTPTNTPVPTSTSTDEATQPSPTALTPVVTPESPTPTATPHVPSPDDYLIFAPAVFGP